MIHEHFSRPGARGQLGRASGPLRRVRQRARRRTAWSAATESRWSCPRRRRRRRCSSRTWKLGAMLLSMSVLYGDEGIRHRLGDSQDRRCSSPTRPTPPVRRRSVEEVLMLDDDTLAGGDRRVRRPSTRSPRTRRSCTTRRARPGSPRASSTPTATSSRTRSSATATTSATASSSTAWASGRGRPGSPAARPLALGRGPVRLRARGRLRSAQAARLPLAPRGHERVRHPHRDPLDDVDRATPARATRRSSASSARPASRSTLRRSAGSASSTASPCSTTTG